MENLTDTLLDIARTANGLKPSYPVDTVFRVQCECGHIILEQYQFNQPNDNGEIGFYWCGFCGKKVMVKPSGEGE